MTTEQNKPVEFNSSLGVTSTEVIDYLNEKGLVTGSTYEVMRHSKERFKSRFVMVMCKYLADRVDIYSEALREKQEKNEEKT